MRCSYSTRKRDSEITAGMLFQNFFKSPETIIQTIEGKCLFMK